MNKPDNIWCIAYINRVFLETIVKDLVNGGFADVRVNIPTVRVLKKRFKGKDFYEEVPLLFNYGFFKLPYEAAMNRDYLMRMKAAVQGIYNWLYRSKGSLPMVTEEVKNYIGVESGDEYEKTVLVSPILVHTIRMREIARLKRIALVSSIYSSDDISALSAGKYIVLKGYPFDNIPAEVVSVHPTKEKVKVRLLVEGNLGEAEVNFSNIFYSIYADPDEPTPSDQTLEGMVSKYQLRADKFLGDE